MLPGAGFITTVPREETFNLILVLAYSVLDQVLDELMAQGVFTCNASRKPPMLGTKMAASRASLSWQNYDLVETGKTARNALAHKGKLLSKADCLAYVAAVEAELVAWSILAAPQQ